MKKPKWDSNKIEDQTGRVAIITGCSSGIGFETALVIASKNAKVIMAVRNLAKGSAAKDRILELYPGADVTIIELDLADLESVRQFAGEYKKNYSNLDLLINNAGVMMPPYSKTKDGFELQFGTNYLGHFALTGQLLDLLIKTPGSRIVNVSSFAHKSGKINFDDLNWESRKYKKWQAYGDSKIAMIYFTGELQRKLFRNGYKPTVACVHPGWANTELQRNTGGFKFLNKFFAQDPAMGALPTLYAALGSDVNGGDYYGPSGILELRGYPKKTEANKRSKNEDIAKKLWEVSEKLTGVSYNF